MSKFEVCIVESRDIVFEIEADSEAEAEEIAFEMEANDAVRDQFRERSLEWVTPL